MTIQIIAQNDIKGLVQVKTMCEGGVRIAPVIEALRRAADSMERELHEVTVATYPGYDTSITDSLKPGIFWDDLFKLQEGQKA